MVAKRSLKTQIQEMERVASETRNGRDASYRHETQLAILETLRWLQSNEPAIKQSIAEQQERKKAGAGT